MRQSRIRTLFTFYSYFRARNIYTFAADRRTIRPFVNEKMPHEVRQLKNLADQALSFPDFSFASRTIVATARVTPEISLHHLTRTVCPSAVLAEYSPNEYPLFADEVLHLLQAYPDPNDWPPCSSIFSGDTRTKLFPE